MTSLKCSVLVLCCLVSLTLVFAADQPSSGPDASKEDKSQYHHKPRSTASYLSDIKYMYKTYSECSSSDLSTCLKLKLYTIIDRMSRSLKDYSIVDGLSFERETSVPVDTTPLQSENEIEASLPRSLGDKDQTLDQLIYDKVVSFFGSHTLKIKFPSVDDMKRSMEEERAGGGGGLGGGSGGGGGGKHKKHGHWIMIPMLLGATLVPLAFGALALLAGKALIVSKLALALASIIGIKKLISHNNHHDSSHEVVVSGGHGGSNWGRNGLVSNLPYNAYNYAGQ